MMLLKNEEETLGCLRKLEDIEFILRKQFDTEPIRRWINEIENKIKDGVATRLSNDFFNIRVSQNGIFMYHYETTTFRFNYNDFKNNYGIRF